MKVFLMGMLLIPMLSFAEMIEEVLYLKGGSIIKGKIIENHFVKKEYKVQIENGSIMSLKYEDVIDIESAQLPYKHQVSIGNLWHSIEQPDSNSQSGLTQTQRFQGIKLHYQRNHTPHIGVRYGLEYANLDRIELSESVGGEDFVLESDSNVDKSTYAGLVATIIASSNFASGWRIYAGAGLYNHHYFNANKDDENYTGSRFELGGGYMWETMSLTVQYQWHSTGQYPKEIDSIFSGGVELGMAF